jgi:hypothetical protein
VAMGKRHWEQLRTTSSYIDVTDRSESMGEPVGTKRADV